MSENNDKNADVDIIDNEQVDEGVKGEGDDESESGKEKVSEKLYDGLTINEYNNISNNFNTFKPICSIFAGFEGFIISKYVKESTESEEEKSGIVLMLVSLIINIFVCMISFFSSSTIKWGFVRGYMNHISKFCMFLTGTGAVLYIIAFMLFIFKFPILDGARYFAYALTVTCFCGSVTILFVYLVGFNNEDRELKDKIAEKMN